MKELTNLFFDRYYAYNTQYGGTYTKDVLPTIKKICFTS